jgi:predicted amidohydrolase
MIRVCWAGGSHSVNPDKNVIHADSSLTGVITADLQAAEMQKIKLRSRQELAEALIGT